MRRLPLNIQTLYADLLQSVSFSSTRPGSVFTQTIGGKAYLYAREKHGAARVQKYLGPRNDPNVAAQAEAIRLAAEEARERRTTVSMLKRAGVPAPSLEVGRVLESLANAGLFNNGLVLVGTAAYRMYSPLLGVVLSLHSAATQDVDLAAVSLAVRSDTEGESLLAVLRRADGTFEPQMRLDLRHLPRRFRSSSGLEVDIVAPVRKRVDEERGIVVARLQCSAQPLRYLEYLVREPVTAVALYGSGVNVPVPQPARYAVHKLIVAQVRKDMAAKRGKDLQQAQELLEGLAGSDPQSADDALNDARARGAKWARNIDRSLAEIGYGQPSA